MKKLTYISYLIIGLLTYLVFESFSEVDIAAAKNNGLAIRHKQQIESLNNMDSVKLEAKKWVDRNRQNSKKDSKAAILRIWILVAVILIQIILLFWTHKIINRKY